MFQSGRTANKDQRLTQSSDEIQDFRMKLMNSSQGGLTGAHYFSNLYLNQWLWVIQLTSWIDMHWTTDPHTHGSFHSQRQIFAIVLPYHSTERLAAKIWPTHSRFCYVINSRTFWEHKFVWCWFCNIFLQLWLLALARLLFTPFICRNTW